MNKTKEAIRYRNAVITAYENNKINEAWENWCKLFQIFQCSEQATDKELTENAKGLLEQTKHFSNQLVYDVTDYGKRVEGYR